MRKRIAILTGGGDVPGLNAAIKAFVCRLLDDDGYEIIGLRRGWASLLNIIPDAERRQLRVDHAARPHQHARDRPLRRHDAAHLAHQSAASANRSIPEHLQSRKASPTNADATT